jgi:uncharacterized repeat protein (TIGR01451 family)
MAMFILMPSMDDAFAGVDFHGLAVQKSCFKVLVGDPNDCLIQVTNEDNFGDSITIDDACDDIGGDFNCMLAGDDITIDSVSGTATCANANTDLPCQLPANGDQVVFRDQSHTMNTPGFIPDTATVFWNDNCETTEPCSDAPQESQAPGATFVEDPDIQVIKDSHDKAAAGDTIPVTATVTNTGNAELTNVQATDTEAGALTCDTDTLGPGDSTTCTGSFTAVSSGTNIVTATGDTQLGDAEDTDSQPFVVEDPSIAVVKDPHEKASVGDLIPVTAIVTNTGNVELTNVQATDTEAQLLDCDTDTLDPGESTTCTGAFIAVSSGTNTVTATGDSQLETVDDTDSQPFVVEDPSIDVTKTCEVTGEDEITWTVTWENTGDVTLTNVSVDDDRTGNLFNGELTPGETGQDVFAESPLAPATYVNIATAVGDSQLETVDDTDTAECTIEERGQEGLTPGFWKANAENWGAGAWVDEDPEDSFNSVFGTDVELKLAKGNSDTSKGTSDDPTLYGALGARGGGENALARHCVAAKLNAENPDVDYPLSRAAVIEQCAEALNNGTPEEINTLKDTLDTNNNLGADISQHWPN